MPEAPQGALRAVFAGIGRILKASDKARGKPADAGAPVNGKAAETAKPATAAPETAAPETAAPETAAPETAAPETAAPETAAPETAAPETAAPETAAPETAAPETAAPESELALPNYDELTIASVRARLRNLSVDQLNGLIAYEKAHAARADFIAMFERRIAKVASEK